MTLLAALTHQLAGGRYDGAILGELAVGTDADRELLRALAADRGAPVPTRASAVTVLDAIRHRAALTLDDELLLRAAHELSGHESGDNRGDSL